MDKWRNWRIDKQMSWDERMGCMLQKYHLHKNEAGSAPIRLKRPEACSSGNSHTVVLSLYLLVGSQSNRTHATQSDAERARLLLLVCGAPCECYASCLDGRTKVADSFGHGQQAVALAAVVAATATGYARTHAHSLELSGRAYLSLSLSSPGAPLAAAGNRPSSNSEIASVLSVPPSQTEYGETGGCSVFQSRRNRTLLLLNGQICLFIRDTPLLASGHRYRAAYRGHTNHCKPQIRHDRRHHHRSMMSQ